jgi:methylaspartate mutase sigma subunit
VPADESKAYVHEDHSQTGYTMANTVNRSARPFILGVAASDSHAVANKLIEITLKGAGFHVHNLGVCTPLSEFARRQRELDAAAVIVGSVNGQAVDDLSELPALRNAGWLDCPVVFGGRPSINELEHAAARRRLRELGIDHVLETMDELPDLLDSILVAAEARREVSGAR